MAEANQIIFIEAFLASKKIKLTLFLQALFKALKTTITFWCFVFVTLFNLQGAHRSQRREFILPHHFHLVKNFFQVFQPFLSFQTSRRAAPYFARRLSRRLAYFSASFSLCQELFSGIFQPVFVLSFRTYIWKYQRRCPVTRPANAQLS